MHMQQGGDVSAERMQSTFPTIDYEEIEFERKDDIDPASIFQPVDDRHTQLRKRFPVHFFDDNFERNYEYLGRSSDKSTPYFQRFDCRSTEDVESIKKDIDEHCDYIVKELANSMQSYKFKEEVQAHHMQTIHHNTTETDGESSKTYQIPEFNINHGYILQAQAKANITPNELFDLYFTQYFPQRNLNIRWRVDAKYLFMKDGWNFKRYSYQYFKFMCRAFLTFKKDPIIITKLKQDKETLQKELFNFKNARVVSGQTIMLKDYRFYYYFFSIISNHAEEILAKMQLHEQNSLNDDIFVYRTTYDCLHLSQFDYRGYVSRNFETQELSQKQIATIINHHRSNVNHIIETYQFVTKFQRLQRIKSLSNQNKDIFNKVEVLSVTDITKRQNDHILQKVEDYFVLVHGDQNYEETKQLTLRELLDSNNHEISSIQLEKRQQSFKELRITEHLFKAIRQYSNSAAVKSYPVLQYMSYNPKHIIFDENNSKFKPNFEQAMSGYLKLTDLPLTSQQRLIFATPDPNTDIYAVLEEIYDSIEPFQSVLQSNNSLNSSDYERLKSMCDRLNENGEYYHFQLKTKEQNSSNLPKKTNLTAKSRLQMLNIMMIQYEYEECQPLARCSTTHQEYNLFNCSEQIELQRRLFALLIQTGIINCLKFKQKSSQNNYSYDFISKIINNPNTYDDYLTQNESFTASDILRVVENYNAALKKIHEQMEASLQQADRNNIKRFESIILMFLIDQINRELQKHNEIPVPIIKAIQTQLIDIFKLAKKSISFTDSRVIPRCEQIQAEAIKLSIKLQIYLFREEYTKDKLQQLKKLDCQLSHRIQYKKFKLDTFVLLYQAVNQSFSKSTIPIKNRIFCSYFQYFLFDFKKHYPNDLQFFQKDIFSLPQLSLSNLTYRLKKMFIATSLQIYKSYQDH